LLKTRGLAVADYATLLRNHTTLACRSVDRIFLEGYVPQLQTPGGAAQYLLYQRGFPMPSSAAFGKIGKAYAGEIRRWAQQRGIPEHHFEKGENKELYARPLIEAAAEEGGEGRVVLLGIAQEKASVWRSCEPRIIQAAVPRWRGAVRPPSSTTSTTIYQLTGQSSSNFVSKK
jgi:hypothetical protein